MENRIAAGDIEIRHTTVHFAEVFAVSHDLLHLFPRHAVQLLAGILRKDIAVLAPLVAVVCNMPLKSEILFHDRMPLCFRIAPTAETAGACVGQIRDYLSAAPQFGIVASFRFRSRRSVPHWAFSSLFPAQRALAYAPQAAGASAGLSAAPQAAGCSVGLSAAPQAAPQAAGFFSSSAGLSAAPQAAPQAAEGAICTFQEARFLRAMSSSSLRDFGTVFRDFMIIAAKRQNKYALFY